MNVSAIFGGPEKRLRAHPADRARRRDRGAGIALLSGRKRSRRLSLASKASAS